MDDKIIEKLLKIASKQQKIIERLAQAIQMPQDTISSKNVGGPIQLDKDRLSATINQIADGLMLNVPNIPKGKKFSVKDAIVGGDVCRISIVPLIPIPETIWQKIKASLENNLPKAGLPDIGGKPQMFNEVVVNTL